MKIILENGLNRDGIDELVSALELATFSEAVCIGALEGNQVYVKCPNTSSGIIFERGRAESDYLNKMVSRLEQSVIESEKRRGA